MDAEASRDRQRAKERDGWTMSPIEKKAPRAEIGEVTLPHAVRAGAIGASGRSRKPALGLRLARWTSGVGLASLIQAT